ncbi:MAG TPA: hypothetical protein VIC59_05765 [Gemmatimonadota bacterium]|jgi:hypothetical protein
METRWRRCPQGWLVLALGLLTAAALAEPCRAQQADPSAEAEGGGDVEGGGEAAAYQFNLAPAKTAPGAVAEILLTPREEGGYAAEMAAMSLPEPSAVKAGATTYVVWLYDSATKKKQRVAVLTPAAGSGTTSFDVLWPKFALVVTAEPSAEPAEWSGVAVLTGQPSVPENPGPATEATETAGAVQPAAAASSAAPASAAQAPAATEAAAGAPAVPGPAGAPAPAPAAAGVPPVASGPEAGAGAEPATAAVAEPAEAAKECANAPADEGKSKKKKKRFSNPTLDAMAAAQHAAEPCKAAEGASQADSGR